MKGKLRLVLCAALMATVMLMTAVCAGAEENGGIIASGECGNNLTWTLYEDGLLSIDGTGAMRSYSSYNYTIERHVTSAPWGDYSDSLTELRIGDSVTMIGNCAFYGCSGLTGVLVISDSVTTIGELAFYYCSGFTGDLVIPDSVTTIGREAFSGCSGFTGSLTIGDSVTEIDFGAFSGCSGFTGELVIPDSVTTIGGQAFSYCSGFTGSLTIGDSVTTIGERAFNNCSGFTGSLTIGDSVTTIGNYAFQYCSGFTGDLVIPDSMTTIGDLAFYGCSGFTGSLTIGDSVTTIGSSAFSGCSGFTGELVIPDSVTTIEGTFSGCSGFTGSLTIPDSVTTIGNTAFSGCSGFTGDLVIPDSVTEIGNAAFSRCSGFTGNLVISDSVTTIGREAFSGCSGFTGDLVIPDSVTTIGYSAFSGCSGFTGSLTIGDSVTTIGWNAFSGCSGFTGSLVIPDSVTTIWDSTFRNCSGFTGSLVIPDSVTTIGDNAFYNCGGFTGSLTIPDSVTTIGDHTFYRCSGFTGSLTIGDSVTTIRDDAFYGCSGILSAYFYGDAPSYFGNSVFSRCADGFTIYYSEGKSGWTAPTWKGYNTQRISVSDLGYDEEINLDSEDSHSGAGQLEGEHYTMFGHLENLSATPALIGYYYDRPITISGKEYELSEDLKYSDFYMPLRTGTYQDDLHYILYNLDEDNKISSFMILSGVESNLVDYDPVSGVIRTERPMYENILLGEKPKRTLPDNCWIIHSAVRALYSEEKMQNMVGKRVRRYAYRDYVYKIIKVESLYGTVNSIESSGNSKRVCIDERVYTLPNIGLYSSSTPGIVNKIYAFLRDIYYVNQKVHYKVYDDILVDIVRADEFMIGGTFSEERSHKYTETVINRLEESYIDFSNKINTKVLQDHQINLSELKEIPELDFVITSIEFVTKNPLRLQLEKNFIDYSDNPLILHAGESIKIPILCYLNLNVIGDEATVVCQVNGTQSLSCEINFVRVAPSTGIPISDMGSENLAEIRDSLSEDEIKSLDVSGAFMWDSIFESEFLTRAQAEQIKQVLVTDVVVTGLPKQTFEEFVTEKILNKFVGMKKISVSVQNINVTYAFRIDTEKYGQLEIEIIDQGSSFYLSSKQFGSLSQLNYKVVGGAGYMKLPEHLKSGFAGTFVTYNLDKFTESVKKIVNAELKSALKVETGEKKITKEALFAEKVWGDTAVDILFILGKNRNDLKRAGWEIITYPITKVKIGCPVDVYVYDETNNLCAYVVNNIPRTYVDGIEVEVNGDVKIFTIYDGREYYFRYIASADGEMHIEVDDMSGHERVMRTITYEELPLSCGEEYIGTINQKPLTEDFHVLYKENAKVEIDREEYYITVLEDYLPGDIDGDGTPATPRDAMVLARYIAGWDGYADQINLDAADLDGDSIPATPRDAMVLARHIAGWDGYETIPLK